MIFKKMETGFWISAQLDADQLSLRTFMLIACDGYDH